MCVYYTRFVSLQLSTDNRSVPISSPPLSHPSHTRVPCFLTPPTSTESSSQQTELPTPSAETDSNQWQKSKCSSAAAEHLKGDIFEDLEADAQLSLSLVKI